MLNVPSLELSDSKHIRVGIFSQNGGGKSSLSKQFRLLTIPTELLSLSEKFITLGKTSGSMNFSFFDQKITPSIKYEFSITHKKNEKPKITNTSGFIFHVFNNDYVRESIAVKNYGQKNKIEGYILGKANIDLSKEKAAQEILRHDYKKKEKKIIDAIDTAKNELKTLEIRANLSEFQSITFENLISDFKTDKEDESFKTLKSKLGLLEGIPEDLQDVSSHKNVDYDIAFIKEISVSLKERIVPSSLSAEFKSKLHAKENFIKEGTKLVKEGNLSTCPFCEQELGVSQNALIDEFLTYIEDAETILRGKLNMYIRQIKSLSTYLGTIHKTFLEVESSFNGIKKYFPSFENIHLEVIENVTSEYEAEVILILEKKILNTSLNLEKSEFEMIENFSNYVIDYLTKAKQYVVKNEIKVKTLNEKKNDSRGDILSLKRRICNAKFIELKKEQTQLIAELNEILNKGKALSAEIKKIEESSKKSKNDLVVDTFVNLLKFVFRDKYAFDKDRSLLKLGEHPLDDAAHDVLSDGEKNVIAFCYYLAETHITITSESDYDKVFFVIDDPVSSMDFHYTYSVCRILEKLDEYTHVTNIRFILLTHCIEFMSILLRNNIILKKHVLSPNKINPLSKELIMPYFEHLADVLSVSREQAKPSHTTPNSLRHILETVCHFENPNQKLIKFIEENEDLKKCSCLANMIQDLSHGIIRLQSTISEDDIKTACSTVEKFLKTRYAGQLTNIERHL